MTTEDRLKEANKLIDQFVIMRDLQKDYFKKRTNDLLSAAKEQEKVVDIMIKDYFTDKSQTSLFDAN